MSGESFGNDSGVAGGEESDIPDYLEVLKAHRRQLKEEDEMLAQGKVPPHVAEAEAKAERKRKKALAKKNTGVYVTGLPVDTDEEEFADFMGRYGGIIKKDPESRKRMVKLYKDAAGTFKGEALVLFFRPESVQQAISLVSGMEFRPGYVLQVERTKRSKKTDEEREKKKLTKVVDKRIKRYDQEKQELGWDEEEEKLHVIIKHVFTLEEAAEGGFDFFEELKQELEEELGKLGAVKSIKIFERNSEGVVAVKYEKAKGAQRCVERMDGRFFGGRTLRADFYDGFSNYEVKETDEDRERRVKEFGKWLGSVQDEDEDKEEPQAKAPTLTTKKN